MNQSVRATTNFPNEQTEKQNDCQKKSSIKFNWKIYIKKAKAA